MAGFTDYQLREAYQAEWAAGAGILQVGNRDPIATITVEVVRDDGSETYQVTNAGDGLTIDLEGVRQFRISASSYPASILFVFGSDASANLEPSPAIIPGVFTLTGSGVRLVAATGTAVALVAGATPTKIVMVKARRANAATIYLGVASVTNNEAAATGGLQLDPGDILAFSATDLASIYVNGTAGDGVTFAYWT